MPRYTKTNQKVVQLISLLLLQAIVVLVNGYWSFSGMDHQLQISMKYITGFSLVAGIVLGFASIYLIKEIVWLAKKEQEAEVSRAHLEDSKELIDVLRTHRHDYLNHLQVIMGCIQLGKQDNAIAYIKDVTESMKTESSLSNLEHPEVAALVFKKMHVADSKGIKLIVDLGSDLRGLRVPATDISRILGNLVDNALAAVDDIMGDRTVEVVFDEETGTFIIEVINKRPLIPQELQERVFEKGFTTKGVNGSGLGLYIVKELTEKYGGQIKLTSDEEAGTVFSVRFPK